MRIWEEIEERKMIKKEVGKNQERAQVDFLTIKNKRWNFSSSTVKHLLRTFHD